MFSVAKYLMCSLVIHRFEGGAIFNVSCLRIGPNRPRSVSYELMTDARGSSCVVNPNDKENESLLARKGK